MILSSRPILNPILRYRVKANHKNISKADSRTWLFRDIQTIGSSGPFNFRVSTELESYNFDLKERLPEWAYDFAWSTLYHLPPTQTRPTEADPDNPMSGFDVKRRARFCNREAIAMTMNTNHQERPSSNLMLSASPLASHRYPRLVSHPTGWEHLRNQRHSPISIYLSGRKGSLGVRKPLKNNGRRRPSNRVEEGVCPSTDARGDVNEFPQWHSQKTRTLK